MPVTPISTWGRVEMQYTTYAKPHRVRFYVPEFNNDPGVGTFVAPTTPADVDTLVAEIANILNTLQATTSDLTFGAWLGEKHTPGTDNGYTLVTNGTIATPTTTPGAYANDPGPVSQMTWSFKDNDQHRMRVELFGFAYTTFVRQLYGGLPAAFKAFADYITGSNVIFSRGGASIQTLISLTSDTNDALQKSYRR